jgi:DNA-directed RNA polymerase subunit RPC12/RpoP
MDIMDEAILEDTMEQKYFRAGDVPGEGIYRCKNCSVKWLLLDFEELPECPECNGTVFDKEDDSNIF